MRILRRNTLFAAATILLVGAVSCTKTEVEVPEIEAPISISALDASGTKALLDATTFNTDGNRIQVYDIYTPSAAGSADHVYIDAFAGPDVTSASTQHIPGTTWPFEDKNTQQPVSYNWTPDGTHKFFGWLAKDANFGTTPMTPETFFRSGFDWNQTTGTLTIPQLALTPASTQFDFLYSDVHIRDLNTTPDFSSPVPLKFSHLFTAFSIGVLNTSKQIVTIKSFKLENLKNSGSATIRYVTTADETLPVVTYGATSVASGSNIFWQTSAEYSVAPDVKLGNVFTGGAQQYLLMWPQAAADVHSSGTITEDENGVVTYPEDYKMEVVYTVTDANGNVSEEYTKRLNFPDMDWVAGKRYYFDVTFADKMVELKAVVQPWNYELQEIDFSNATVTIKENHYLTWDSNTAEMDNTNRYAFIKDGQPVKGSFTLDAPQGGTWLVSLTGDVDAFEVSPSSGLIDGTTATISVKPLVADPQRDYSVNVKFAVRRPDGRVIAADDIVQPANSKYTIVLPKN